MPRKLPLCHENYPFVKKITLMPHAEKWTYLRCLISLRRLLAELTDTAEYINEQCP